LSINGDFIIKQKGFWTQKTEIIELYKLQGISTNQAYWFKNRNIENVTFHTAGGDLSFPLVNQSEIKSRLNYIFYAVETTDRAWM
jgi:putative membrane protein